MGYREPMRDPILTKKGKFNKLRNFNITEHDRRDAVIGMNMDHIEFGKQFPENGFNRRALIEPIGE